MPGPKDSSNNRLYFMIRNNFLEFDLDRREFTFAERDTPGTAMSMAEGPDGKIYAATYPTCNLLAFDPEKRTYADLGRLDEQEQYPSFLDVDAAGWVYAGIGNSRANLVSFNPETGERRQLVGEDERRQGVGVTRVDEEGVIYGRPHVHSTWSRWRPFPDFIGHGTYPLSEPETRAVADFIIAHPNIRLAADFHTGNPAVFYPEQANTSPGIPNGSSTWANAPKPLPDGRFSSVTAKSETG